MSRDVGNWVLLGLRTVGGFWIWGWTRVMGGFRRSLLMGVRVPWVLTVGPWGIGYLLLMVDHLNRIHGVYISINIPKIHIQPCLPKCNQTNTASLKKLTLTTQTWGKFKSLYQRVLWHICTTCIGYTPRYRQDFFYIGPRGWISSPPQIL